MASLSKTRVNLVKSFLHTGVYFTGHIWANGTRGKIKMYLLIFTCLNIRALYIGVDRRYDGTVIRVGFYTIYQLVRNPSHIYSDNDKAFLAAGMILKEVFISNEYTNTFGFYQINCTLLDLSLFGRALFVQ